MLVYFCYSFMHKPFYMAIDKQRILYLDAVRGIAAMSVLIFHVIESHWGWMKEAKIANIFFNGSDAVAMFFVLSGLVLSLKAFEKKTPINAPFYRRFAVSRVFRLYPAFLVMLVIYAIYERAAANEPLTTTLTDSFLLNKYKFWEEALLVRENHTLFLPDWTLGVEVGLSLLVPFMILLIRYDRKLFIYAIITCLFIGKSYISEFTLHFALGVLIAFHFQEILQFTNNNKWWYKYRWYLLPLIIVMYSLRHVLQLFPAPAQLRYLFEHVLSLNEFSFSGPAAAILLLLVVNSIRLRAFLSNKILLFIGEISYGIYLSHWLFTLIFMRNFEYFQSLISGKGEFMLFLFYLSFTVVSSIFAGYLLYRFVEKPFIQLGRKLNQKLDDVQGAAHN